MLPTSQLVPAYANAAMALKPGQTSGLVRSPFGYHIIQLEKKQAAGARLTLAQVETLITHGVPDSTLSSQIRVHGLTFTPTPAILDSLHAKGAGPLILEAIQEAALNSDVSKPGGSGALGPENGSPASGSLRQASGLQNCVHLILQVEVKETVNAESDNTIARLQGDLKTANISFSQVFKPDWSSRPEFVEVDGVAPNNLSSVRAVLNRSTPRNTTSTALAREPSG